jgi:hypothetical protein
MDTMEDNTERLFLKLPLELTAQVISQLSVDDIYTIRQFKGLQYVEQYEPISREIVRVS